MSPSPEVEAVMSRCQSLLEEGLVKGVPDSNLVALYLATTEVIERADLPSIVRVIKEGIDEAAARSQEALVRELAFVVLLYRSRSTPNGDLSS